MFDDPIVDDIRRVRHAHAKWFNNDLGAIVADLRRLENESGRSYVNFEPRLLEKQTTPVHRQRRDSTSYSRGWSAAQPPDFGYASRGAA